MTFPHTTGFARESAQRADSRHAAEVHARSFPSWWPSPIDWTPGNIARLVALIAVCVAIVTGIVALGRSMAPAPYSVDTTTPLGAVGAYFEALSRRDFHTADDLLCERERRFDTGFVEATAEPLRRAPMEPWPVILWEAEPREDAYVVEAVSRDTDFGNIWVVQEGDHEYRVCGFARP
jgi:hypothetical protein